MRAALVWLALCGCAHADSSTGKPNMTSQDYRARCRATVEAFAKKEFAGLRGLPAGCLVDDVAAVLAKVGTPADGMLGEPPVKRRIQHFRAPAFGETVRAWLDG